MVTDRRPRRGRPRKDELAPTRTVYHAAGQLGAPDPERLQAERERRSCFVLITDLKDALRYDARRLLREYRDQVAVETRFRFLKNPIWVDAMFVHRRDRFEALAYVLVIACLVYTIIERRARCTLRAAGEILHILGKRMTSRPTAQSLLEMFTNLTRPHPPPPLPACSSLRPTCGIEPIASCASSVSLSTCTAPFPNSPAVRKSALWTD